jgi:hypothetical protein
MLEESPGEVKYSMTFTHVGISTIDEIYFLIYDDEDLFIRSDSTFSPLQNDIKISGKTHIQCDLT